MIMKPRTVGEAIKHFASVVEQGEILLKQNEVVKLISGPISIARQKLRTLDSRKTEALLAELRYSPSFGNDVRTNVLDIFEEQVLKVQRLLKEVDSLICSLQESINDIAYRLRSDSFSKDGSFRSQLDLAAECYEHCRSIMIFFKLKNKILKHYVLTPVDVVLTADPFSQFPNYKEEEENVSYLMCKIEYANLNN